MLSWFSEDWDGPPLHSTNSGTSPGMGEDGFSLVRGERDPLETRERVSDKQCVVLISTT